MYPARSHGYTRITRKPVPLRGDFDRDIERGVEGSALLDHQSSESVLVSQYQSRSLAIYDTGPLSSSDIVNTRHEQSLAAEQSELNCLNPITEAHHEQSTEIDGSRSSLLDTTTNILDAATDDCGEKPSIETDTLEKQSKSVWAGWQKGVTISCACSIGALICNIALYIWARSKPLSDTGTYILTTGSHHEMNTIDTWIHVGINVLSTIILAGSNYSLQVLLAPTRKSIDCAHDKHRALSVGITSLDGWKYLCWRRRLLYICLVILMIPLHLVYNSIIFSTIAKTDVPSTADVVTSDFLQQAPNSSSFAEVWQSATQNQLTNMTISECHDTFVGDHIFDQYEVLVFTNISSSALNLSSEYIIVWNISQTDQLVTDVGFQSPNDNAQPISISPLGTWIASWPFFEASYLGSFLIDLYECSECGTPTIAQVQAEYCLARTRNFSSIELMPQLLITIIICNVLKIAILVAIINLDFSPLVTIGDAISSFLDTPDAETKGIGPVSARDLDERAKMRGEGIPCLPNKSQTVWQKQPRWYFNGVSVSRLCVTLGLCLFYWLGGVISIATIGPPQYNYLSDWAILSDISIPPQIGAGQYSLISTILITNTPQLALSMVYLFYNSLFTCMQVSAEFVGYAKHRKSLRVSKPEGDQRGTYFLSLPYKFSIPFAIISMLLHWLMSQSIYFVASKGYNLDGSRNYEDDEHGMAFVTLPFTIELAIGGCLIFVLIGYCFRKYSSGIPLVRSNSIAISAACHPDKVVDKRISTQKIQYGVISKQLPSGGYRVGFGCDKVTPLIPGQFYE